MDHERDPHLDLTQVAQGDLRLNMSRRQTLMFGGMAAAAATVATMAPLDSRAAQAASQGKPIDIVFMLYPTFTLQDFAGANEVFARLPEVTVRVATPDGGPVTSDTDITFADSLKIGDVTSCDIICVPGGTNHKRAMMPDVQENLRRLAAQATYVTSICNGSLILGNAGLLKGKRSACWWGQRSLLKQYGAIPDPARVVIDGRNMSGGGVTAGIDFALTVGAILRGEIAAQVVQLTMEYAPDPPFKSGRVETAPPEVIEAWKKRYPTLVANAGL